MGEVKRNRRAHEDQPTAAGSPARSGQWYGDVAARGEQNFTGGDGVTEKS